MKKVIGVIAILALVFTSCSKEMSLQKYMVTKSGEDGFLTINVPASMLQFKDGEESEENVEALKKFKRLNVLVYKHDDSLAVDQKKEVAQIKRILENAKFNELMSVNMDGNFGVLSYSGGEEEIDEVVAFGENDMGFLIARITGDKMNVKQLAKLASSIDLSNLEEMKNINFGNN